MAKKYLRSPRHIVERYHGVEGEHEVECLHIVEGYHSMQRQGPVNPARKFLDVLSGLNMWTNAVY